MASAYNKFTKMVAEDILRHRNRSAKANKDEPIDVKIQNSLRQIFNTKEINRLQRAQKLFYNPFLVIPAVKEGGKKVIFTDLIAPACMILNNHSILPGGCKNSIRQNLDKAVAGIEEKQITPSIPVSEMRLVA